MTAPRSQQSAPTRRRWPQGKRATAWSLAATGLALAAWLCALNACATPLRIDPLARASGEPAVDRDLEVARRYAPWIYHEIDPRRGRQDQPAPIDFDGNLSGDDNWENFPRFELLPTVYYAHLETATHRFLTYHLFHPRDWACLDLGLHMTHEGDGENLQVVVDKANERVVLLFTQAHYRGCAYAREEDGFGARECELRGPFLLIDESGRANASGTHAAVFVESGGHGIYGALDEDADVAIDADGAATFRRAGIVLRPARAGEAVREPELAATGPVLYQLASTTAALWPGVQSGESVGRGRLFDGPWRYEDARVAVDLPRYHRGNRFSGPFGSSRGISPFAVDYGWSEGELGVLFFDPARRHAELLRVPEPWSREYLAYPYSAAHPCGVAGSRPHPGDASR